MVFKNNKWLVLLILLLILAIILIFLFKIQNKLINKRKENFETVPSTTNDPTQTIIKLINSTDEIGITIEETELISDNIFIDNITREDIKEVIIGNGITSIGRNTFSGCTSLTSITIPDSVTEIGYGVFMDCSSLTSIIFNENSNLESIGIYAFDNCSSLNSITIPNKVTNISRDAFRNCESLKSIEIPDSVTSIGNFAFSSCSSLTSITFNENSKLETIGNAAFHDCISLTSITIPDSVTEIGTGVFMDCSSLTSITIPDSVTEIGYGVFMNCSSLTSIIFNENSNLESIGIYAFDNCSSLNSITIPNKVTNISREAFRNCESLKSIKIPYSVTSIGNIAFQDCTSLTSVTFDTNSELDFGINTFTGCTKLASITFTNKTSKEITLNKFVFVWLGGSLYPFDNIDKFFDSDGNTLESKITKDNKLNIPSGGITFTRTIIILTDEDDNINYKNIVGELISDDIINDELSITKTNIKEVIIGNNVTSIGDAAFQDCTSLTSITFYNNGTETKEITIGKNVFSNTPILYNSDGETLKNKITANNNKLNIPSGGITFTDTKPSTTQPSTTQPSTTQPSTTQPSTTQPSTTQPESSLMQKIIIDPKMFKDLSEPSNPTNIEKFTNLQISNSYELFKIN